jgi:hypothetical protein
LYHWKLNPQRVFILNQKKALNQMTTSLAILEYRDIGSTARGPVPIPLEPAIAEHSIDLGAVSKQSRPFHPETVLLKLTADADCKISIGPDADATNSVRHLAAGREIILAIIPNSKLKIAAVAAGSGSSMSDSLGAFLSVIANPAEAKKHLDALTKQAANIDAAAKSQGRQCHRVGRPDTDRVGKGFEPTRKSCDRCGRQAKSKGRRASRRDRVKENSR